MSKIASGYRKIKKHKIGRKTYHLAWKREVIDDDGDDVYGTTSHPAKKPVIEVSTQQSEKEMLDTLVHEALHAVKFSRDENVIKVASKSISDFLWKVRFRIKPS